MLFRSLSGVGEDVGGAEGAAGVGNNAEDSTASSVSEQAPVAAAVAAASMSRKSRRCTGIHLSSGYAGSGVGRSMSHASASLVLLTEEDERESRPDGDRPGGARRRSLPGSPAAIVPGRQSELTSCRWSIKIDLMDVEPLTAMVERAAADPMETRINSATASFHRGASRSHPFPSRKKFQRQSPRS